ncbi:uncharacterized protein LOC110773109 isoform X1 [Prunus avium]|uniref:Uncharacterized protein LOC110773109 isoform X1 n=1 Tax=Prunus avium TaxID=42229 RepID=A0A6P5U2H2_PRUAV|nr:uncharacterized protein LOC110773109 isoform X1 [Prunus avium]
MADADELDEIVRRKLATLISRVTQEIEFRWDDECLPLLRRLLHVLDPVGDLISFELRRIKNSPTWEVVERKRKSPMDLVSTALQLKMRLDTHWNERHDCDHSIFVEQRGLLYETTGPR